MDDEDKEKILKETETFWNWNTNEITAGNNILLSNWDNFVDFRCRYLLKWETRKQTWRNCSPTKCITASWLASWWVRFFKEDLKNEIVFFIFSLLDFKFKIRNETFLLLLKPQHRHISSLHRKLVIVFSSVNFYDHWFKSEKLTN